MRGLEIVVVYDVSTTSAAGRRRLRQVAEVCLAYGQRVQQSVFECVISPAQLLLLEHRLLQLIEPAEDRLRIYYLRQPADQFKRVFGARTEINLMQALIA
jgi:CRISPR-associated protein Cas2